MNIMICSSMKFSQEILATKKDLENLGHTVSIPLDTEEVIANPELAENLDLDYTHSVESDILRKCFQLVADADAILVLNHRKNDIDGYIGTSVLMEIGLAHFLKKDIFLLYPIPSYHEHRWAHEVSIMNPTVINGDMKKITKKL